MMTLTRLLALTRFIHSLRFYLLDDDGVTRLTADDGSLLTEQNL